MGSPRDPSVSVGMEWSMARSVVEGGKAMLWVEGLLHAILDGKPGATADPERAVAAQGETVGGGLD
jgi:hypothetical protein